MNIHKFNTGDSSFKETWEERMKDRYILIELTDFCNYNCIMCSHDNRQGPHSSPQGFMDRRLFEKILSGLKPSPLPRGIKLFWLGEPLLNPAFPEMAGIMLKWLDENPGKDYLDIHTNAFFLEGDAAELLLRAKDKLPRLTLSIDAAHPETYSAIRRGGDLKRVEANIESFLKRREALGQVWPTVIFQFIVMEENWQELGDFVNRWTDFIDSIVPPAGRLSSGRLGRFLGMESRPRDVIWIKRVDVEASRREWAEDIYNKALLASGVKPGINGNVEIIASVNNLWEEPEERARIRAEHEDASQKGITQLSNSPEDNIQPSVIETSETATSDTATSDTESTDTGTTDVEITDNETGSVEASDIEISKVENSNIENRGPCSAPFKTPCIRWDGELTVCCFDPAMQLSLGNLRNHSLEELWNGEKMKSIRQAHIDGRFANILTSDGFKKCLACPGYDTPSIEQHEISEYLMEITEECRE